jgi:Uncharacterized conserved protein
MEKTKARVLLTDFLFLITGAMIYAVSINMFTAPNNIAPGGISGISTMLNYLFGVPIGLFVFLLNIPIMVWSILDIGYKLVVKTLLAIVLSSVIIDVFSTFLPVYTGDMILVALFAGLLEGVGLSLTFLRGATTGGTDMTARLLQKRYRHIPMGKLMLVIDGAIVAVSAVVYQNIESAMYACIVIFVATTIIDTILYGADRGTGKTFFVISPKTQKIGDRIMAELERGITFVNSRGGYSNEKGEMLFCAVRRYEVFKLNEIIRQEDRDAFVIVGDAGEISGEGFKPTNSEDKSLKDVLKAKPFSKKTEEKH